MAVDEALVEEAASDGVCTLRFYQWNSPTLSLGYFQPLEQRQQHPQSAGAAVVRRLSGGGAILHDRELTYSLCLPAAHPISRQSTVLYGLVHDALIDDLAAHGITARRWAAVELAENEPHEPEGDRFLCFERRMGDDVVLEANAVGREWAKIAGSAQRRRRGAILQHGSVLLATSPLAPQLPGIRELCDARIDASALARSWADRLASKLRLALNRIDSQAATRAPAVARYFEKFQSAQWTARR